MQISYLCNEAYGGVSGLSRYEYNLLKLFRLSPSLSIQVVKVPPPPLPRILLRLAHRLGYDLLAFHQNYPLRWPPGLSGLVHLTRLGQASLLLRKRDHPVVITVHDLIHYKYRRDPAMHIYRNPLQARLDSLAVWSLNKADAVLASSAYTRQCLVELAGIPAEKIHLIYPGIDAQQFRPLRPPAGFYTRYGLSQDTPYLLHISTEEARKNVPRLLQAFARLKDTLPEMVLLKIGRPLYPTQRQHHLNLIAELGIQDSVIFINDVPDEDLPYFYNASRLLIFPSLEEGFGFPVLEAMACGLPVICSRAASLPELAGDAAWLVDPLDVQDITRALLQVLADRECSASLSSAGLEQVKKFSWQSTAAQTLEVYRQVMEAHHAG